MAGERSERWNEQRDIHEQSTLADGDIVTVTMTSNANCVTTPTATVTWYNDDHYCNTVGNDHSPTRPQFVPVTASPSQQHQPMAEQHHLPVDDQW